MRILFTDRALPTVIVYRVYIEYIYRALPTAHRSVVAGAGGGGVAIKTKITAACAFISVSRFRPSLIGLVPGRSAEPQLRSQRVCKSI